VSNSDERSIKLASERGVDLAVEIVSAYLFGVDDPIRPGAKLSTVSRIIEELNDTAIVDEDDRATRATQTLSVLLGCLGHIAADGFHLTAQEAGLDPGEAWRFYLDKIERPAGR
jgi:hypothetical protein